MVGTIYLRHLRQARQGRFRGLYSESLRPAGNRFNRFPRLSSPVIGTAAESSRISDWGILFSITVERRPISRSRYRSCITKLRAARFRLTVASRFLGYSLTRSTRRARAGGPAKERSEEC